MKVKGGVISLAQHQRPTRAKMKGFSAWPGKICFPPDGMKRPVMKKTMHCVEFFGTHDFAWILEPDCKPYMEFRETLGTSKKSPSHTFKL